MYFLIGLSLLFAFLFSVNVIASIATTGIWHLLAKTASGWDVRTRVNFIFLLRVTPLAAAVLFIFAFILPSFVLFEPSAATGEAVGIKLTLIALVAAFGIAAALGRIFASWWRTRRLIGEWMRLSEPIAIEGVHVPAFRLRHPFPVIAVVGVIRPKMFVAEQILSELDDAELAAAIAHECGHLSTHDNFKRIAMRICGDLLVFPLGKTLDSVWSETAESAADEYAADRGGRRSALNLASALIKVGRITPSEKAWVMPTGAFLLDAENASLALRVDRLLQIADFSESTDHTINRLSTSAMWLIPVLASLILLLLALNGGLLSTIHLFSEALLAALQ